MQRYRLTHYLFPVITLILLVSVFSGVQVVRASTGTCDADVEASGSGSTGFIEYVTCIVDGHQATHTYDSNGVIQSHVEAQLLTSCQDAGGSTWSWNAPFTSYKDGQYHFLGYFTCVIDDSFTLSNGGNKTITQGSSGTNTITSALVGGAFGKIKLSYSISPTGSGMTVSYQSSFISIPVTSNLTIAVPSNTPNGTYTVTLTGTTPDGGYCKANLEPKENFGDPETYELECGDDISPPTILTGGMTFAQIQNLEPYISANQICGTSRYATTTSSHRINYTCRYSSGGSYVSQLVRTTSFTVTVGSSAYIDIGLRVTQKDPGGSDDNIIVPIAADPLGTLTSPLHIAKGVNVYGVSLVDPSDPAATKALIRLANGTTKALRKFIPTPSGSNLNLSDKGTTATGYCSGSNVTFYGTINITNNTAIDAQLVRTSFNPIGSETAPSSFTLPANSTLSKGGFGNLSYSGCPATPPSQYGSGTGSAVYNVNQNGTTVDTVTYSWDYAI